MAMSRRGRLFLNTSLLGAGGRSSAAAGRRAPSPIAFAAGLEAQGFALPTPTLSTYSMHVRYNLLSTGRLPAPIWWSLEPPASQCGQRPGLIRCLLEIEGLAELEQPFRLLIPALWGMRVVV
jgi:hypothetical protein